LEVRFDVFNILFAHKNTDYKTNTHLSTPKTPWPLFLIIRKQGGAEGWRSMKQRLQTSRRWHQKVSFVLG
jgi:hypothetical protein